MKKKYIVYPGYVFSKNDGDRHFISADRLMNLYRVNPKECIVVDHKKKLEGYKEEDLISLYPDSSGRYKVPEYYG